MREIQITWQGVPATVKIEDDLPFGIFEDINRKYVNVANVMKGDIKIDMVGYMYAITLAAVKEAPWPVGDLKVFKDIPRSVGQEVVKAVCAIYPLKDSLLDWMEAAMGEVSEEDIKRINRMTSQRL